MKQLPLILLTLAFSLTISAKEYHVAKTGNDKNKGSLELPLLTIWEINATIKIQQQVRLKT